MKKLIGVLIISVLSSHAWACKCAHYSLDENYTRSDVVIHAKVLKTSLKQEDGKGEYVEAHIEVMESFKSFPHGLYVSDLVFKRGNCSIGLQAGLEYVFFIKHGYSLQVGLKNYVGSCSGSRVIGWGMDKSNLELLRGLSASSL